MKKFAVFDIDGTLIRWQLYHAVADALAKKGYLDGATYDRVKAARKQWKIRAGNESFKNYEAKLIKVYDQLIKGLPLNNFNAAVEDVISEYKDQVYTYTRDLIKSLRQKNYLLFAISSSQAELVSKIASYYGFDDWQASTYLSKDGRFTGAKQTIYSVKDKLLDKLVKKHGANYEGSLGVGDSESDIDMLEKVERAIAFNPTAGLFKHAKKRGWQVVVERKNVIYELEKQGNGYILAKTNG